MGGVLLWGGNKEVFRDEGGVGGPETRLGRVGWQGQLSAAAL